MYARVTVGQSRAGTSDEGIRLHRDSVAPACKQQKGFKGLYLLIDEKTNKSITITLWETEADMNAAEASGFYKAQIAKFKDVLSAVPAREEYEVVLAP